MAQHARTILRATFQLSRLSGIESVLLPRNLICAEQSIHLPTFTCCNLGRTFASGNIQPSRPEDQFTVLSPTGAGGPVLRTSVFAIFELGSKQYKVSPGDYIYAERLKGVDVGAQLALGKIQAAGSATETLVGRPYIAGASVTAVVEEQVQDAKVITFKKRRRKNSRRTKGHRQLLTGIRITGINGIMAPEDGAGQEVVAC